VRALLLLGIALAGFASCVPAWSAREIAGKADKGLVSRMKGDWAYVPDAVGARGDRLTLSMVPGKTSQFRYARGKNLEQWTVNPVKIGSRTFADVKLTSSRDDSTTIATWGIPADSLRRYHLIARFDLRGDTLLVGFLDDDATASWLDLNNDPLDYAEVEAHATDVTLLDRSNNVKAFLRKVQDVDSLFTTPVVMVRSRLEGGAPAP
jgi:hypothetical protein